jgi:spermidine synthase
MAPCMEYLGIPCCVGSGLRIKVKALVYYSRSAYQEIAIYDTEPYGRCLFLDGVIQCAESDHEEYDRTILNKLKPTDKSLLVLGGGDGYTAEMALRLNPGIQVTVVELDGAVISACKLHLDQKIFDHPSVNLVIDDAFHFMERAGNVNYDCIICDLTDLPVGYSDIEFKDFYLNVFSLSTNILNRSGWISIYSGCNADIANDMISSHLGQLEKDEVFISSFGEPCYFVHGYVLK